MPEMPVREAMRSDIITAKQGDTLNKVARLMTQWKVGVVVVIDGDKPIGLITEKDIMGQVVAEDLKPSNVHVEDIMSSPVITVSSEDSITDAFDRMMEYDVSRLPVMDGGDMVGIISKTDISNAKERAYQSFEALPVGQKEEEFPYGPAICEICGQHNTHLRVVNGRYVCDDCANIAEMDTF
jgi:CBS domain-containing protein